jgi:hypothetical protein
MIDPAIFAGLVAAAATLFWALAWRSAARSKRTVGRLREQLAGLERERAARPSLRATFEFDGSTRDALVHVTNDGGDAEVWASMSVEGALAQHIVREWRAQWRDGGEATLTIRRGQSHTLRVGQLDLSVFPYAQWQVFAVGPDGPFSVRAMHASTIGGDPETQAPTMFLQVGLASEPESWGPPAHCTIALQPFDAVRLRPL